MSIRAGCCPVTSHTQLTVFSSLTPPTDVGQAPAAHEEASRPEQKGGAVIAHRHSARPAMLPFPPLAASRLASPSSIPLLLYITLLPAPASDIVGRLCRAAKPCNGRSVSHCLSTTSYIVLHAERTKAALIVALRLVSLPLRADGAREDEDSISTGKGEHLKRKWMERRTSAYEPG